MTFEEYYEGMAKALADLVDKEMIRGMSLLSIRKKKKIRKWIMKALAKEKTLFEKARKGERR